MLFGRSKSKPRKFPDGISKLKISSPTPIDTININGGFIDLVKNPQTEAHSPMPLVPPTPSSRPNHPAPNPEPRRAVSDAARDEEAWLAEDPPANISLLKNQGGPPAGPAPTPRQLGVPPPPTSPLAERSSSSVVNSSRSPRYPAPSPSPSLPYSRPVYPSPTEERASTPTGRNFSRKLATPTPEPAPDSPGRDNSPPRHKVFDARNPQRDLDQPSVKTIDAQPFRPPIIPELGRPPSRGRRRDRNDKKSSSPVRLPLRDLSQESLDRSEFTYDDSKDRVTSITQSQEWEQLREVASSTGRSTPASAAGRYTPQSEKPESLLLHQAVSRSSSVYSGEQTTRVEDIPQHLSIKPSTNNSAPPRTKTPPTDTLEGVSYFDPNFALNGFDQPISPLLPSPPQRNERRQPSSSQYQERGNSKSRESEDQVSSHLPPLDLARPDDKDLYNLFSSDSDIKNMPSRTHEPVISGPTSPLGTRLPSYLGPLQDVQTSTPITPMSPVERLQPKLGIGRKVSTRLRGLIGGRQRPPYEHRNAPSPESPGRSRLAQVAISEPVPIPEEDREVDPEIERLKQRFDLEAKQSETRRAEAERALADAEEEERQLEKQLERIKRADQERTARRRLEAEQSAQRRDVGRLDGEQGYSQRAPYSKVDNWNYNPSASTSKSSLSEVMSASEGPSVVSDPSDPGLSSHRSSVSKYGRDYGPVSPITPADEFSFSALRAGETMKSNSTARAPPSTIGKRSVEVPVFLCQDNEEIPSFSHEPPTPNAREIEFDRNSFMPSEVEKQLEGRLAGHLMQQEKQETHEPSHLQPRTKGNRQRSDSNNSSASNSSGGPRSGLASAVSTAPTSIPSPLPPVAAAAPSALKPKSTRPPFAGGPKLLRSATMSSRPGGNKPLKKPATAAAERLAESVPSSPLVPRGPAPRPPTRSNTADQACEGGFHSPPQRQMTMPASTPARHESPEPMQNAEQLYDEAAAYERRHGPAIFSFAPSGFGLDSSASSIFPDDSISCIGSRNTYIPTAPSSPVEREAAPILPPIPRTPVHVPSETDWQPQLRSAKSFADLPKQRPVQNNRVALLSGNLRVDTSVGPAAPSLSATEPAPGRSNTVKRSKSYGGGLRRAFSRRAPANPPPPSPPPVDSPTVDKIPQQFQPSLPTSPVEQPPVAEADAKPKAQSGTLVIGEKHLRPRKGSITTGKCTYCQRGPFANMWVCLDEMTFVVCRMCCNEMVTEQKAELF